MKNEICGKQSFQFRGMNQIIICRILIGICFRKAAPPGILIRGGPFLDHLAFANGKAWAGLF